MAGHKGPLRAMKQLGEIKLFISTENQVRSRNVSTGADWWWWRGQTGGGGGGDGGSTGGGGGGSTGGGGGGGGGSTGGGGGGGRHYIWYGEHDITTIWCTVMTRWLYMSRLVVVISLNVNLMRSPYHQWVSLLPQRSWLWWWECVADGFGCKHVDSYVMTSSPYHQCAILPADTISMYVWEVLVHMT